MPGIARAGQDVAGGVDSVGSPNVHIEGKPAVRIGDSINPHGRPPHTHAVMASGSSSVFVNNIPVCRSGDTATCGHVTSGSGSVFAN
jgi:uncharacterized Zn-binding protein involved in type VI secretion